MSGSNDSKQTLIFSYGTLKQGFANHYLMQDLIDQNAAVCLGPSITLQPFPLVCGPYNIPYLINLPGSGNRIKGELYSVSTQGLVRMDELEGTSIGHYDRLPVQVQRENDGALVEAEAYFANCSFGEGLWEKKGKVGMSEYSEKEGREYVTKAERAQNSCIIDDIAMFLSSSD
ncbi:Gamma-glutamylcyclotransferase, AIG2-like [Melia azedarach]|uniref:Gamma-glutamylcyclotransferase, AIG2-like n=1 Tax=Melia azedarach TaxID=155640 RepID=A0ACC1YZY1_MELAZ|nr:Gamma-glutamylcyclotransferase, AIG2-like [Melia azedarach]